MKKILVLLCIFLIVGVYSFADQVEFTIEGDAKVTFGVDLNDPAATGFINETSSNLKIELIAEQEDEKGADAPVYGWIKLKEFKWEVNKDGCEVTLPGVEAKIMADPLWVKICSNPDVDVNKASIPVAIAAGVGVVDTDIGEIPHDSSGGLEIGIDTDVVDVVVKVVSENDWKQDEEDVDAYFGWYDDDDNEETVPVWQEVPAEAAASDKNTENAYAISGELSVVAVEGLELKVMANAAMNYTTYPADIVPIGLGVGLSYDLAISEDITIIPIAGLDIMIVEEDMVYEVGGGVRVKWPGTFDDEEDLKIFGDDTDVFSGLSIGVNMVGTNVAGVDPIMNLVAGVYEDSGDDGFLPVVGGGAVLEVGDLTGGDPSIGVGVILYASKDKISGYAGMKTIVDDEHLELLAGLEVSDIVPNTSLMIDYISEELQTDPIDNGILTLAVKIAY
jgi:hypothetical protein